MGRGRLRRGFSLEVIFEEDQDLCSYLDSLDSLRILQDNETDQLSVDSLVDDRNDSPHHPHLSTLDFSKHTAHMDQSLQLWDDAPSTTNGRRSRVSRRHILAHPDFHAVLLHTDHSTQPPQHLHGVTLDHSDDAHDHTYAVADAHDDVHSSASSTQDYSDSSATTNACALPHTNESDVRRVREIFERTSRAEGGRWAGRVTAKWTWEDDAVPPVLPPRNPNSRASSTHCIPASVAHSTPPAPKWGAETQAKAAWKPRELAWKEQPRQHSLSSLHLNRALDYDVQDLLVNDKVVIEESPDIFQTLRSSSIRAKSQRAQPFFSSLRRTKSMGTGIFHPPASPTNSPSCILKEEMPAPNIVKNVRNVFERLSTAASSKGANNHPPTLLSSIKSNPTSKILRSESFREPPPPSPPHHSTPSHSPSDQLSLVSSGGEDDEPKLIPPQVLSRIRSCGTTTTYFGGQIVAKTIENRTLRVNASPLRFSPPPTPTPHQLQHLPLISPPLPFSTNHALATIPRIVSVVTKGASKRTSPNGSVAEESCAEGRNSPEGCESDPALHWTFEHPSDSNNNHVKQHDTNKKFSEINEGAWF